MSENDLSARPRATALRLAVALFGLAHLGAAAATAVWPLAGLGVFRRIGGIVGQPYPVSEFGHLWRAMAIVYLVLAAVILLGATGRGEAARVMRPLAALTKGLGAASWAAVWVVGRVAPHTMLGYPFAPYLGLAAVDAFCAVLVVVLALRLRA